MYKWDEKSVLVTGATGFIGSWLTESLVSKNASVSVFVKKDDPFGLHSIKHLKDKVKIFYGDIRDVNSLKDAIKNQEIVFHLAAVTQVIQSKMDPRETFEVNALGTLNVLESIRASANNPFLVHMSTDKVYGEPKFVPITEDHPLLAKSPYDASKVAAEKLVSSYNSTYDIYAGTARPSNNIGGRDANILRAVPNFVIALINNKSPTLRGNGKHVRDYIYVGDTVNGLLKIAETANKSNGEAFNFGTGRPTTSLELANMMINLVNPNNNLTPVILGEELIGEIDVQYLSYEKAKNVLEWEPTVKLEEALMRAISWYKENAKWQEIMRTVAYNFGISSLNTTYF